MSTAKKTLWATVTIGALGIVVALVAYLLPRGSSDGTNGNQGSGNVQANNATINAGGNVVIGTAPLPTSDPALAIRQLKEVAGASSPPKGAPPWPFVVLGTADAKILWVRDGVTADDHRAGNGKAYFRENEVFYADCQVSDGWNADPSSRGGTKWYKVRWPSSADKGEFYSYSGWAYPVGHNGALPECG